MLPSNQGDIKNVTLEPGRHQICNPLDSFDRRCESVTYTYNNSGHGNDNGKVNYVAVNKMLQQITFHGVNFVYKGVK